MENVTSLFKDFLLSQNGIGERKSLSILGRKDTSMPESQPKGTRGPQTAPQRLTSDPRFPHMLGGL